MSPDWCRAALDHRNAKVETLLREAVAARMDLAVSEPEMVLDEVTLSWRLEWHHLMVEPGVSPPPGRRWSVYHSGG